MSLLIKVLGTLLIVVEHTLLLINELTSVELPKSASHKLFASSFRTAAKCVALMNHYNHIWRTKRVRGLQDSNFFNCVTYYNDLVHLIGVTIPTV